MKIVKALAYLLELQLFAQPAYADSFIVLQRGTQTIQHIDEVKKIITGPNSSLHCEIVLDETDGYAGATIYDVRPRTIVEGEIFVGNRDFVCRLTGINPKADLFFTLDASVTRDDHDRMLCSRRWESGEHVIGCSDDVRARADK